MRHSIPASSHLTCLAGDPLTLYASWRERLTENEGLLLVEFALAQYWLDDKPSLALTALYCVVQGQLQVAVTDQALTADGCTPGRQYLRWVNEHKLASFEPGGSLQLQPATIAKPWGQEIWYSGVEQRGVCNFSTPIGQTPIPWLQAVAPDMALGEPGAALVLLKILDPLPQPVTGDLYFELHEAKREVYVVTHVDSTAWPDGIGYIRLGFDPQVIGRYASEAEFRQAYLEAVQAYESVRRAIDTTVAQGQEPGAEALVRERTLRAAMDGFTHNAPVRVGDVVSIPLRVPHSLQHGVRTIEFQTPVYERKILSFAQQVITQQGWDTTAAVAQMLLIPPAQPPFEQLQGAAGVHIERIVDFPDFEVRRVRVVPGAQWQFEPARDYGIVMIVCGRLCMCDATYEPEQALLLPAGWEGALEAGEAAQSLVLLWASPRS